MNTIHRHTKPVTLAILGALYMPPAQAELVNEAWVVRSGDGLYGIARKLAPKDLKMQARIRNDIAKLNPNINTANLDIGFNLKLPDFLFEPTESTPNTAPVAAPAALPEQPAPVQVSQAPAATPDPQEIIGKVVIQTGSMVAENRGSTRKLNRTASILKGDTLKTAGNARSQVRLIDGALIAISPDTVLKFEDFSYNGSEDGTERSILSLIKGGFRTITGTIGHVNKQNYQVKTSVATIGIRGTHYGLMLCEGGSCQNNAEQGNLSDGLYGGVVDGSVVTENASGPATFGNDQYFHIETAQTPPVETLLPPPIFNDAPPSEGDKPEGHDMAGPPAEGDQGKPPENLMADGNPPPDGMPPGNQPPPPKVGGFVFNHNPMMDFMGGGMMPPKGGMQFEGGMMPPPPMDNLPPVAPVDSGMLLAFSREGLDINQNLSWLPEAHSLITQPSSQNGIFLMEYADSAGNPHLVPVGFHEEHMEYDLEMQTNSLVQHNGALRHKDGTGAYLDNVGQLGNVVWGRWAGDYQLQHSRDTDLTDNLGAAPIVVTHDPDLHFIYSNNRTPILPYVGLGGVRGSYEVYKSIAGTLPTDSIGGVGNEIADIKAAFNFTNQVMLDYRIHVETYDTTTTLSNNVWDLQNTAPVAFADLGKNFGLSPTSAAIYWQIGQASLLFVGDNAGAAITSYSMRDSNANLYQGLNVNGVAVLMPATTSIVATPTTALFATADYGNPTAFGVTTGASSPDQLYMDSAGSPLAAFDQYTGSDSQQHFNSMFVTGNPSTNVTITPGTINTANDTYWGRWDANTAQVHSGGAGIVTTVAGNPVHFIHTTALLSQQQINDLAAAGGNGAITANYGLSAVDATLDGAPNTPGFTVAANFSAQTFNYRVNTGFDLDISTPTIFLALEASSAPNTPFSELNNFSITNNACPASACTGQASLNFAGSITNISGGTEMAPTHAITSYSITGTDNNVIPIPHHAAGAALLVVLPPQ